MATTEQAKQASLPASLDREESKPASFDSEIAPLEAQAGEPLRGPWRRKWEAQFDESPEGFCRVRDNVLERPWVEHVFAYFNRLLDDGDHRAPAPAPRPSRRGGRRGLTEAEILELDDTDDRPNGNANGNAPPEPSERCPECSYGGNLPHLAECSLAEEAA